MTVVDKSIERMDERAAKNGMVTTGSYLKFT